MQRFGLIIAFFLLVAGLPVLRALRFERDDSRPTVTLDDLRALAPDLPPGGRWVEEDGEAMLVLSAARDARAAAFRMPLPDGQPVGALHVRINVDAKGLIIGQNDWADGRVLVEWRSPDGATTYEVDPVCSQVEDESETDLSVVMMPAIRGSLPVLRVENLGSEGEYRVFRLELTPVTERTPWQIGRWFLLAGWCGWLFAVLSHMTSAAPWRKVAATLLCVGIGLFFIFPGPWKRLGPMGIDYRIGAELDHPLAVTVAPPAAHPNSSPVEHSSAHSPTVAPALNKVQVADGWILTIKRTLADARPLLHAFLLMGPTFCLALLVGRRSACVLGIGISAGIELAQVAFGFGFDLRDVGDLLSDGAGIALAMGLHALYTRWLENRRLRHHG